MLTAAEQLTRASLCTLQEAVPRTGRLTCIEPVFQFVLHVPIGKRPTLRTEEDTRPIAMEDEVAKTSAIMLIAHMEQYGNNMQWVYQRGRLAGDVSLETQMKCNVFIFWPKIN